MTEERSKSPTPLEFPSALEIRGMTAPKLRRALRKFDIKTKVSDVERNRD